MAANLKPGELVVVNMGVSAGRNAVVVPKRMIRTNGRGVPLIDGHYKPLTKQDVAIRYDNGKLDAFNQVHLSRIGGRIAVNPELFSHADLISSYSRKQAIEDGVLVDVTDLAKEAGIKYPVALTRAVYERCVALPKRYRGLEDVKGRLWDVLSMFRFAARVNSGDRLLYRLKVTRRLVTLKAIIGPGDTATPVITIMLPEED